jgi:hypothetical protein
LLKQTVRFGRAYLALQRTVGYLLNAVETVKAILNFVRKNNHGDGEQLGEQIPEKVNYIVIFFCCVENAN